MTGVVTLHQFRKQGVGNRLLEELIRRYGTKEMVLVVKHKNEAAQKLYQKFNFKPKRRMVEGMLLVRAPDASSSPVERDDIDVSHI